MTNAATKHPVICLDSRVLLSCGDEFACKARNVTTRQADFVINRVVVENQVAVCYLENFGLFLGKIFNQTEQGFSLRFEFRENRFRENRQSRFAAQLEWYNQHISRQEKILRAPRIVPLHRPVEVRLCEAIVLNGFILNISVSGAAIKLDGGAVPFVGSRIRVGSRLATVVRTIDDGIAVVFAEPIPGNIFDERVRP